MRSNVTKFLVAFFGLFVGVLTAQQSVTGVATDQDGIPLPGVNITIKGTESGATTDLDGNYSIEAENGSVLVFSFVGYSDVEKTVNGNQVNVQFSGGEVLDEVVITALGIKREKKALGYAVQGVKGEDISDVKSTNIMDALSGEVSGLDIQSFNQMGGSANVVVRGYSSITGNNQALIIVDGTPINNGTGTSSGQSNGRGGFDYGNGAMDINPDDVASVDVLKGAAATALYGSRASNGVILITTKKGSSKGDAIGITINSSYMVGNADSSTLPKYQKSYGAGYGPYYGGPGGRWDTSSPDGVLTVLTGEDASYGPRFDPNQQVYQWWNLIPEYEGYGQTSSYAAPTGDASDFLRNSTTLINSLSFGKGDKDSNFRLSYSNMKQEGILPNSELERNTFALNGTQKFDKLTANASITYVKTEGLGRYGTGYDNRNPFQSFRQWYQVGADLNRQKDVFEKTGGNYSWNMNGPGDTGPHYFDNPYWMRYNTFSTDAKNRYFGNIGLNYEINEDLSILGRITFDSYDEIREERINVGSVDVSKYTMNTRTVSEYNYDLISTYDKDISENLNLNAIVGWNLRVEKMDQFFGSTNGGLNFPGIYNFDNTKNALTPLNIDNIDYKKQVDGIFGRLSLGYLDTYYLEGTFRRDRSTALPMVDNTYYYPSVSGSVIFSKLIDAPWLNFGKIRANYAQVGADTNPYSVFKTYGVNAGFGGQSSASNPSTLNNRNLKSELTTEKEFGIEAQLFNKRFGFDISIYDKTTDDLITGVDVSSASGVSRILQNAGSIQNKGIEAFVNITPIRNKDFSWDMKLNFAKNKSEVISLAEGTDFLQFAQLQGGVTIGAKVGQPFGVIRGRDFVYHENGQKVVYTEDDAPSSSWVGVYARTDNSNNVIGDMNPDWTGGIKNSFRYKNLNFSFLIDIQKGGDLFSLDTYYGYATGIYDFTAGTNDLGNPIRNSLADGGGVILDGVNADGSANTTRAGADRYTNPWGYARTPTAAHIHDASFVKLRELSVGYTFPQSIYDTTPINNMSLSLIGRNLWIIHKNLPYSDPEAGLSAGNTQGYQSGAYPSVRELGLNLKIEF